MFLRHTSCPRCGSTDANAIYAGGSSFCFSCRSSRRGTRSPYSVVIPDVDEQITLPHGCNFSYSKECLDWVFKYGITIEELIKNRVYWCEEKQQLIFTFYDEDGELLLWQARNFGSASGKHGNGPRTKYFTKGKPEQLLPIYPGLRVLASWGHPLVIVEDCISAIKIARYASSMPVLGSSMSAAKLTRLSHLPGLHRALVWLDGNMYDKAQAIAGKLQMLGIGARAVYTELDPKCLSDTEIEEVIRNNA